MKIVHLCLASFFPDNYSYQENLLPKFHKELGYDVEVIASTQSFDEHGKVCYLSNVGTYRNEYDIKVTRLPYKTDNKIWKKLKRYQGCYEAIELNLTFFLSTEVSSLISIRSQDTQKRIRRS